MPAVSKKKTVESTRPKPSFGFIEVRQGRSGETFRAIYRTDGTRQTKTFDTYTEAYDLLEEFGRGVRKGKSAPDLKRTRTSFSDVAWEWYGLRHPKDIPAERGREFYAIKKFESTRYDADGTTTFGEQPIDSLTRQDFQRWINTVTEDPAIDCLACEDEQVEKGDEDSRCAEHRKREHKPLSPKSTVDYYGVVSQIMHSAQLDKYVSEGALPIGKGVGHVFPEKIKRMVFLTEKQMERLLKVCLKWFPTSYALVHLVAHTGLRQGEALGLTRDNYNAVGRFLLIKQSAKKRTRTLGTTKTKRERRVDLFPCCVEVLNEHLAGHDNDLVFPDSNGKIVGADNWRNRVWNRLIVKAGFENLHFHDLRHSHCSLLLEQGWRVEVVADRLGHASAKMTLDVYTHVHDTRQRDLIDKAFKQQTKKPKKVKKKAAKVAPLRAVN